ncbi:organomercurial lyase [Nocardia sp. NBC_01388]|uniref:organomercurial lyase n=1 Tax=Nocardia sp. NBC_01388 TaxID=2903596 RepID=UPI003247FA20
MKLEILQVTDCPNVAVIEQRVRQALADSPVEIEIEHRVIDDDAQAAGAGMTGSPTLLVDGHDLFAVPGQVPSVSCRLYRTDAGGLDGAPSVAAIRAALGLTPVSSPAHESTAVECCQAPASQSAAETLSTWRARAQPADPIEKAVHHAILRSFATRGTAPTREELTDSLADPATPVAAVLRNLHDADVIRLDSSGSIVTAYPFSTAPTTHRVRIRGGATVNAMCAVDALGMAAMLGTDITIEATAPGTGEPITIAIHDQQLAARPPTTVVFVGGRSKPGPSVDTCCNYLNFFPDRASSQAWADAHPTISGSTVDLPAAHQLGNAIFGNLLHP